MMSMHVYNLYMYSLIGITVFENILEKRILAFIL